MLRKVMSYIFWLGGDVVFYFIDNLGEKLFQISKLSFNIL